MKKIVSWKCLRWILRHSPAESVGLKQVKVERDNPKVQSDTESVEEAQPIEKKNLMPYILDAVRAYATVGEMVSTMKEVYGEAQQVSIF